MDFWLEPDGTHKDYTLEEYNIDHITPGRAMLMLYKVIGRREI